MIDIIEEVIYHLTYNIKTKLGVSSIGGVGVFAIKDIEAGERVFPTWEFETGIYLIPNDKLHLIPNEVNQLLHQYFINDECGYKVLRLYNGMNFLFHGFAYCNSAWPDKSNQNMSDKGIALRDIKVGEEILEWYTKNIDLANSK
jgi:hypothetical protein